MLKQEKMPHVIMMEEEKQTETPTKNIQKYKKPGLLPACVIMLSITTLLLFVLTILLLVSTTRKCQ